MSESNGIKTLASGRYQARYRFAPGSRGIRTATFDRRGEAKSWLVGQESAARGGAGIDPRHGRIVLGDYFADWLGRQHHQAPGTRLKYGQLWRTMLAPTFGRVTLGQLGPAMAQRWQAQMLQRYERSYVSSAHTLLSQVLTAAVNERKLPVNPLDSVAAPRVERKAKVAPAVDTVARLFDHAPQHLTVALHLGLGAGLRSGEIRGLTVDRIDLERRLLTVDRQLHYFPPGHVFADGEWHHGREAFAPRKGGRSLVAPIGPVLAGAIETHLRLRRPGPHGLVVTALRGGPMGRGSWDREWDKLRARAGVPFAWGAAHQLRHAYASWMLEDGESLANVARNLGHARASFTLDMYVHPTEPRVEREPADRFARVPRVVRQLRASDQRK
jgi:integrase